MIEEALNGFAPVAPAGKGAGAPQEVRRHPLSSVDDMLAHRRICSVTCSQPQQVHRTAACPLLQVSSICMRSRGRRTAGISAINCSA